MVIICSENAAYQCLVGFLARAAQREVLTLSCQSDASAFLENGNSVAML